MELYTPDPNPPGEPKECQRCGNFVTGENVKGWWLERYHRQNPNEHILFCLPCCVEKMSEWPNYDSVSTVMEARQVLEY